MENINGGYVALAIVGVVFFGLQVWWISMTINNGRNERLLSRLDEIEEIKKELEKVFSKTARKE